MNPLERSQIEKAGYDNGCEVTLESNPDKVLLCSARHSAMASIGRLGDFAKERGPFSRLALPGIAP